MSAAIRLVVVVSVALSMMAGGRAEAREVKQRQIKQTTTARLVSITENGDLVDLRLENGKTISVGKSNLRIRDHASTSDEKERRKVEGSSETNNSVRRGSAQLRQMRASSGRPAAVRVVWNRHGKIKRVHVHFFRSEADVAAFLQAGATRQDNQ